MSSFPVPNIPQDVAMGQEAQQSAYAQPFKLQALAQDTAIRKQQAAQESQMRDQAIEAQKRQFADQDALTKTMSEYDPQKNTLADILHMMGKNGASGRAALEAQQMLVTGKTNLLKMTDDQFAQQQKQNDLTQGFHDQVTQAPADQKQQAYQQGLQQLRAAGVDVSKESPQYPGDQEFAQHLVAIRLHTALVADTAKQREADANAAKAANENAQAALTNIKVNLAKNSKPGDFDAQIDQILDTDRNAVANRMTKAMVNGALGRGDWEGAKQILDQAYQSQQEVQKYKAEQTDPQVMAAKAQQEAMNAKATQPYKIEQAAVEGKTRQMIQGMGEAVYALDPKSGQKTLMSKTDALQSGVRTMLPVTEKQVSDDTMLINRLSDVHQKISRFEQALNRPIDHVDRDMMAGVLGSDKFKAGAFGVEIPVDRWNAAIERLNLKSLSPNAQKQLIAYYNAREALVGYNRVLSGSGRSSDKALELQEQTLPNPATAPHDYASEAIRQFKENLQIVGQGLPNIPGVKTPDEWEQQVTAPGSPRSANPRSFPTSVRGADYLNSLLGGH